MKGWQCPVCSRVWSPATAGCDNCNGGSRDLKQRAVVGWTWDLAENAWKHPSGAQVRKSDSYYTDGLFWFWPPGSGDTLYAGVARSLAAAKRKALGC